MTAVGEDRIEGWRDQVVWQKSRAAAVETHRITKNFPSDERFRITDPLCRAATPIPTDIAEEKGRGSQSGFRRLLTIARGSTEETRCLLPPAKDSSVLPEADHANLEARCIEVSKMLNALLRRLRA